MLDIPQSNPELVLDCLEIELANTKCDLDHEIHLPSISFNLNFDKLKNIAMLQGD